MCVNFFASLPLFICYSEIVFYVYIKNCLFFLIAALNDILVWLNLIYLTSPLWMDIMVISQSFYKALMNFFIISHRVLRGNLDVRTVNAPWVITVSMCKRG